MMVNIFQMFFYAFLMNTIDATYFFFFFTIFAQLNCILNYKYTIKSFRFWWPSLLLLHLQHLITQYRRMALFKMVNTGFLLVVKDMTSLRNYFIIHLGKFPKISYRSHCYFLILEEGAGLYAGTDPGVQQINVRTSLPFYNK